MSEAAAKIVRLERRVMWRTRMLSLQDSLALAVMISAVIAAGFVVIARLRPITIPVWVVIIGTLSLSLAAMLIRWFLTRTGEREASFLIDASLKLDDRIATSRFIIQRGGPASGLEQALIEDAAARVDIWSAPSIVPFRTRVWYPLVLISAIALAAAIMIPSRSLPVDQALATEHADIAAAGEHLEQTATDIEQSVPLESETATLAREQAEIGRGFRRASATRAEALKRLSALEERIRLRHDDLSNTRADEIVNLADRRMRNALSTPSTARRAQSRPDDSSLATPAEEPAGVSKSQAAKETRVTAPDGTGRPVESTEAARQSDARGSRESTAKTEQAGVDADATKVSKQEEPPRLPQEPVSSQGNSNAKLTEASLEALKAVPDSLAQQAAKALPKLSEELLKKAAELRADELKPGDIEKLRKAAEFLAGDLAKIAQSEELQKALQEMARQVRPEQIEQVARELGNQEQLKRELEAAARLLSENQQAKEMVAGLAGQFARMQDQRQGRDKNRRGGLSDDKARAGDGASQSGGENSGGAPEKIEAADRRLGAQGRESKLKGKLQERPGGEYLYLQSKAGVGAARAPYSSVYPQYRREAERSVQRSQVPPNLRTVVRKYFDAINPDAKR